MRKILTVLILGLALVGSSFAEKVRYQVKYENEWHNTETAWYDTDTELFGEKATSEDLNELKSAFKFDLILDKDADAKDLAIIHKLDRQGYAFAMADGSYGFGNLRKSDLDVYIKLYGRWHKLSGVNYIRFYALCTSIEIRQDQDEPVILDEGLLIN